MLRTMRSAAWIIFAFAVTAVPGVGQTAFARPAASAAPSVGVGGRAPSCAQLPQQLDLTTLSDAELLAYGLPLRADVLAQLPAWTRRLASRPQHVCARPYPIPGGYSSLAHHSDAAPATAPAGSMLPATTGYLSTNWAGNVAYAGRGTYRQAEVTFYVPHVTGTTGASASAWAGVGGDGGHTKQGSLVLVQAGVQVSVLLGGGQFNKSWVEVYPQVGPHDLPLCRLNTGDEVYVYVESNLGNDGYDYFYMDNITANCYHSCTVHTNNNSVPDTCGFTGGPGYNSDSGTGECILERNGRYPVAQWDGNHWRQYVCAMNSSPINHLTHDYYSLVNTFSLKKVLVYPGSLDANGDFDHIWKQAN
jgi:hypothetical protein